MPRCAKTDQIRSWSAPPQRGVGGEDRVALVEDRRLGRREPHRAGDQLLGRLRAVSGSDGDQRAAQVPQRLAPDLAVEVHLVPQPQTWPKSP